MVENWEIDPLMGKKVKDVVTGFAGIITGRLESLYGCTQYVVTAKAGEDGKVKDNQVVIDEGRVKVVGQGIRPKAVEAKSGRKGAGEFPISVGKLI